MPLPLVTRTLTPDQAEKLQLLIDSIPKILAATDNPDYDEIYGYRIAPTGEDHVNEPIRNEILLKFLIATEYDVAAAIEKVAKSLKWRKQFQVLNAAYFETYDPDLEKLGVITNYTGNTDNFRVVTWNLYANLKNPKKLFAKFGVGVEAGDNKQDLPGTEFLRWRIGLMERSLLLLDFTDENNLKIAQVHDYNNVSMFRIDPGMKAATKEIITVFSDNYPELLSKKYFINVPLLMGWVFAFFKATGLMSAATLKKFEMLNHGNLSEAFDEANLPKEYNGGKANEKVPLIFSSSVPLDLIEIPEYAQIIIKKFYGEKKKEQVIPEPKALEEEAKSID